MFLGIVLSQSKKHVEARAMLRRARELDPLFPLMFANSAVVALTAGEPEEAIEFATQAIAINPEFWVGYLHLGNAQRTLGNYEEAIEAYAKAEKLSGDGTVRATSSRAWLLAKLGREDEAREILVNLIERSANQYVSPYYIAIIYAALGETDAAFEWLEQAIAAGSVSCAGLNKDRRLESLRADVRFEAQARQCKTALAWDYTD
jgi:tetratricopeptide (TPR) repeat protein